MKNDAWINFLLYEKGTVLLVNGGQRVGLITDASTEGYFHDRMIRTKEELHPGDLIAFQNATWMVTTQVTREENSSIARMRLCNHVTKFILADWLYPFPSVIEMERLSIDAAGAVFLAAGSLTCTLRADDIANTIAINQRFVASDAVWTVVGVDKTNPGLVLLNTERTQQGSGDDMVNEIANADTLPTWTIALQSAVESVPLGDTLTVTAILNRSGVAQEAATFLWSSANASIVSVADGVLSGVAEGSTTVTVRWAEHPSVSLDVPITVEEVIQEVVSYKFYCVPGDGSGKTYTSFDIFQGDTNVYGVEKYVNDVLSATNDTYTFTFTPNGATTSNYTYTVLTNATVSVRNKLQYLSHACTLSAVSNQTGTSLQVSILLKGNW